VSQSRVTRSTAYAARLPPFSAPRGSRSLARRSFAAGPILAKHIGPFLKRCQHNSASNRKTNYSRHSVLDHALIFLCKNYLRFTKVDSDPQGTITQPSPEARLIIFARWKRWNQTFSFKSPCGNGSALLRPVSGNMNLIRKIQL